MYDETYAQERKKEEKKNKGKLSPVDRQLGS